MKVNIYSIDGKVKGDMVLPAAFETPFRPDVIKKAFEVARGNARHAYGASPESGRRHAVSGIGKGHGASRVPRIHGLNRAGLAPNVVGGMPGHGPKSYKNWSEKINKKENQLAIMSAIAATADAAIVAGRGHKFKEGSVLPVVVEDKFESLEKTAEVAKFLESLGLYADVERAEDGVKIRAGRGKMRARRRKEPTGILIVASKKMKAGNLAGVDVITPEQLNVKALAPGGVAGRLAVFTEAAVKQIGGW
ncbi:MAG: 50S ribosomal protein L4 [Candidatus Thermoplasmatota archaeon]|nr:50S ribosomal protein L4 [Candidatus Thermoplasmatota archaeon]